MRKKSNAGSVFRKTCAVLLAALALPLFFSCAGAGPALPQTDTDKPEASSTASAETDVPETEQTVAETETAEQTPAAPEDRKSVLDGKKVIFIGNSMIYYGGVVTKGSPRSRDPGWFYRICRANGDETTVIDCTYGNHHLYDFAGKCKTSGCDVGVGGDLLAGLDLASFDYVFMSESGNNNSNFVSDVRNVMKRFTNPETKFVYMCHTYSYDKGHSNITSSLRTLQKLGVIIADWGHICFDLYMGIRKNPGATVQYVKNTFVNNVSGDSHHPNPLAGYIAAQTCYCAVTGRSAVGQSYADRKLIGYGSGSVSYSSYTSKYYTSGNSNFTQVFDSPGDMEGIQGLIDEYVAKWAK